MESSFWERLAAKTRPTKPLESIENPISVVMLVTGSALGAVVFAVLFAIILAAFDAETVTVLAAPRWRRSR